MIDLSKLTRDDFAACLNDSFCVMDDPAAPFDLQLFEVTVARVLPRQVAFSIFFHGPANRFLPQMMHNIIHPRLGDLLLFLVPVGQDETGYIYEAVFNHLSKAQSNAHASGEIA